MFGNRTQRKVNLTFASWEQQYARAVRSILTLTAANV